MSSANHSVHCRGTWRDIDLANLNEPNQFIVPHLRECILVVDANDRIRQVNDTAARLLAGREVPGGAVPDEPPSLTEDDRQLTDIIEKNSVRAHQVIENVPQQSRKDSTRPDRVDLPAWLDVFLNEVRQTLCLEESRIGVEHLVAGLEVINHGAGIAQAHAERISEPFFTAGAGGTGLGLFISRELCQANGAVLVYEARHRGGSILLVVFADPQRGQA